MTVINQHLISLKKLNTIAFIFLPIFFVAGFVAIKTNTISMSFFEKSPQPNKTINIPLIKDSIPPFLEKSVKQNWVDSIMDTLSLDNKIAQLFMVAAYSNKDANHEAYIKKLVTQYKIGGLIFMQGTPTKELNLTNRYQKASDIPLMLAIDGEWGLPMRLKNTFKFPKQMTLGAVQHDSLIYEMGKEVANHCKRIGLHVNFAPVVDVNNNRNNPVINYRSFGEDRVNVAEKGIAYMRGMQENGVLACAKHFPGHGDTDMDSHLSLPTIPHDINRLDSIEFYPFKRMIKAGVGSMMVAHLYIPVLDSTKNMATTLSPKVVNGLLKDSMKFEGLIFTDALNMKGVSSYYKPGEVDVMALLAGNDVLLFSEDVPTAIKQIKLAITNKQISEEEINKRCRRILQTKKWLGLDSLKSLSSKNLNADLHPNSSKLVNRLLFENALTLVKNDKDLLPLKDLKKSKVASIVIGDKINNSFQNTLSKYFNISHYSLAKKTPISESFLKKLKKYNTIIVSIHGTKMNGSFNIDSQTISNINKIAKDSNSSVILNYPTNPYALEKLGDAKNIDAIIVSYEDNEYTKELVPQLIFGGIQAKGKLPVEGSKYFPLNTGIRMTAPTRLKFTTPEEVGISSDSLKIIDRIAKQGINLKAYPGCQVLGIKGGKVFYNKSFGYHTYDKKRKVDMNTIYDLASITKVASTTSLIMHYQEKGMIHIDSNLGVYLPDVVDSTDYRGIILKEMLTHQARFTPWIPFYVATLDSGNLSTRLYNKTKSKIYDTEVAKDIYIFKNYQKAILKRIVSTPLRSKKKYKYSDIGYYFLQEILKRKTGHDLDYLSDSIFYSKMGLPTMGYLPLNRFKLTQITPTENDKIYRNQLIHGYVHDQGAAMLGGIGGHAGLFSNALDLGTFMQMILNNGEYGGDKFIDSTIIAQFTSRPYYSNDNRRGIGFDKPVISGDGGPASKSASAYSFGHSGFTGTIVWIDPKHDFIYVFLSNRVYPDADNWKLVKKDIRTRIQESFYKSFNTLN